MATFPNSLKRRTSPDLRLGIKSSFNSFKPSVAALYVIYKAAGSSSSVQFTKEESNGIQTTISLADTLSTEIRNKYGEQIVNAINGTPLFSSQIESLQVAFSTFLRLAKINFVSNHQERTGNSRYDKTMFFTEKMVVLDLYLSAYEESIVNNFLTDWLNNRDSNTQISNGVKSLLTTFIEDCYFKLRFNDREDLIFNLESIYETILNGENVTFNAGEKVGPLRILNSFLNENMHSNIEFQKKEIQAKGNNLSDLKNYAQKVANGLDLIPRDLPYGVVTKQYGTSEVSVDVNENDSYLKFITALRTKLFLLLAGISGTGKSQKVQELAFMTCPKGELRENGSTTPGNYCLIEVKPNWHDSTELLGYYSALSGKYELTEFIRFTYKALRNPEVPFFLCLDEMNLAPVEQYFAEFLSVLETRKKTENGIESQPLLPKEKFSGCKLQEYIITDGEGVVTRNGKNYNMKDLYSPEDTEIIEHLKDYGLQLPANLFVIGTVNMDDTTHQFSRKVIDRAFIIEMNGGKMDDMFSNESRKCLDYREKPVPLSAFASEFVRAYEVIEDERFSKYAKVISEEIPALLGNSDGTASKDSINGVLNNTPFRVSYRVQNELILYLSTLIENANFPDEIDSLIAEATLAILLEKVLPRVQGEQKQLETQGGKSNILKDLKDFVEKHFTPQLNEDGVISTDSLYFKVIKKLEEMDDKLIGYYTNFF